MKSFQQRLFSAVLVILFLAAAVYVGRETVVYTSGNRVKNGEEKKCVVLDAGHGGDDPGKIGINGAKEKNVNLQITEKVKKYLEANDIRVIMTRESSEGLYDADAPNKKVQDMKRRIAIIEEADPVLVVSIHQNSYQQESVKGAQVFYYATSERSRMLASMIQKEFQVLQPDNRRLEKGNDSYYLLKKTAKPIVIAECGFLSNAEEAEKLVTQEYQELSLIHI